MRIKSAGILLLCCLTTGCSVFAEKPNYASEKKVLTGRSNSEKAKSLTDLGIAYYQLGKYEYASDNLRRALALDSHNAITYQTLALINVRRKKPEQAELFFLKALEYAPKDFNILTAYAVFLYEQDEVDLALVNFKRVIAASFYQNKWTAYTYLGFYDLQTQQQRAAEMKFYTALKINPSYALALIEMAKIRYAKAEMMSARGFIERYFNSAGKTLEGLVLAIKIETALQDPKMVEQYQLELTRAYPFSDAAEKLKHSID